MYQWVTISTSIYAMFSFRHLLILRLFFVRSYFQHFSFHFPDLSIFCVENQQPSNFAYFTSQKMFFNTDAEPPPPSLVALVPALATAKNLLKNELI